jgi:hypothetical protein
LSEFLVRELFALAKVFDNRFGARLKEPARHGQVYMVFDLSASYAKSHSFTLDKSFLIYT